MTAGERLMALRKEKKETRRAVAVAVGVSESSIYQYEHGDKVPRDGVKIALSKHFGKSVQSIFFD